MKGDIAFLIVSLLSITNGNPATGKQWHWKPRMPVRSPDVLFSPSAHIMGRMEAAQNLWPYQVALFIDDMYFCFGSLISNEWVLTTAHCMDGARFVDVVMGAFNLDGNGATEVSMTSSEFFVHENWNSFTLANDIAAIKLPEPVSFNENINSVALPSVDVSVDDILIVTRSDNTPDGGLIGVDVKVVSNSECAGVYGSIIDERIVCVVAIGGQQTCSGSGSLTNYRELYGVPSFGPAGGCDSGYPEVFTRVFQFLDWIENITGVTPP